MAAIRSLGIHKPAGLAYLIAEGYVSPSVDRSQYNWQTYTTNSSHGPFEEEILYTTKCVVWSCAALVRAIYRFELDEEDVKQAFLTTFPESSGNTASRGDTNSGETYSDEQERALVIRLETKLHIYFLHGSHHAVDLRFPVSRAYPALQGIILLKAATSLSSIPPTPKITQVPQNSFFSSQFSAQSSYLQSPSLQKSFNRTVSQSLPTAEATFEEIWQNMTGIPAQNQQDDDDVIYTLINPFSEPGLVTEVRKTPSLRLTNRSQQSLHVEFDCLDSAEELIYISPKDELAHQKTPHGSLVLVVSINRDRNTLTVWHGWYLNEKPLSDLMKRRNAVKADKARRRSSFLTTSIGTGTTTPAVRTRDTLRESFVNISQLAPPTRKMTAQSEEVIMASQLDPDFVETSQQTTKETGRRISSQVSRGELVSKDTRGIHVGASFGTTSYRRGTSFGGDRRSFRKSRGSTPGSVLSRSFAVDDEDSMDFGNESDIDIDETVADTIRIIRASHEASGAESLLGAVDGVPKRDFVVQKLHVFTLETQDGDVVHEDGMIKVITTEQPRQCTKSDDAYVDVLILDRGSQQMYSLSLWVRQSLLNPDLPDSTYIAIPLVRSYKEDVYAGDIIKLADGDIEAVLFDGTKVRYAGSGESCVMSRLLVHRLNDPYTPMMDSSPDAGRNRTISLVHNPGQMLNSTVAGRYDELRIDGTCQRQSVRITPQDPITNEMLFVCEVVLPIDAAKDVRRQWLDIYQKLSACQGSQGGSVCSTESIAAAAVILGQVIALLDERSKAALLLSRGSANKRQSQTQVAPILHRSRRSTRIMARKAWSSLEKAEEEYQARDQALPIAIALALESMPVRHDQAEQGTIAMKLMLGLHILCEEYKLNLCKSSANMLLAPVIAQLGQWLNINAWMSTTSSYYGLGGADSKQWAFVKSNAYRHTNMEIMETPIGVCEWMEHSIVYETAESFPPLSQIAQLGTDTLASTCFTELADSIAPRTKILSKLLHRSQTFTLPPKEIVEAMMACGITNSMLDTLPEGLAAPMNEAMAHCERDPPAIWTDALLQFVGREDLISSRSTISSNIPNAIPRHDVHTICSGIELPTTVTKTREADRNAISQLIFNEDRRLVDASSLLHFNTVQVAECVKQPDWTDAFYFEQQRRVMQYVITRMIALPIGDGILHFSSQYPLMTEKYHLPGFSSSCIMQPIGHTVTTDRSGLTEEKVNWAYFHAGVASGLRISKAATGIDTSWLVFNKPNELTHRHAGLLLALGLNGHLKSLAKWLSFKYLTPKHTMTSLGLLLGLAASHLGSMDGLITRMLSVHISCMLPPGAAELNVSSMTQTAGLLGIGLLYHNTQHRRMTETMLQEIETTGVEDPDNGPDALRDESYRLAAGFALGLINIGRGRDLRGLHGVQLQERLLRAATGSRPVHAVHVLDKATAGATMAIAMVYMKSRDAAVARQIDVPDTEAQFEHVRPDMLMLRSLAKHIILWDSIVALAANTDHMTSPVWIPQQLPNCCKPKWKELGTTRAVVKSSDLPFYYIITGLALAMSMKYAGSGHKGARNEVLATLDILWAIQKKRSDGQYYYDTKIARAAIRQCIDALVVAAAAIMSGTGDIYTFRYLRRLHGRTDAETTYGSHLASHMGIGILFMGGGTCTFGTSDLAIAALLCSLYPLFPVDIHDNKVHLQAFRHLWVFAVEHRCLIVEDVDAGRPVRMPVHLTMKDGREMTLQAPCILPDLNTIASISTIDTSYWRVSLDFGANTEHIRKFRTDQRLYVRHCPASEAFDNTFWATFSALDAVNAKQHSCSTVRDWIFGLSILHDLDKSDIELILPRDEYSLYNVQIKRSKIDDRLTLLNDSTGNDREHLWELRVLLAWIKRHKSIQKFRWLEKQILSSIDSNIDQRRQKTVA